MTRLVLGAYHRIGIEVLREAAGMPGIDDLAVVTHPPALPGTPDIREAASELGVWTTTEHLDRAALPFEPDMVSLVYYRHIVSQQLIERVDGRIFNVHPSLLPRHRGASSVPWAIIEGDRLTGVTFHYVDAGVDTGDVLLQLVTEVSDDDTQLSLYERLMDIGAAGWRAAFELVRAGVEGVPQVGSSCHHSRGVPFGGEIDPTWDRAQVGRFIRAMTYPPLAPARFRGNDVTTLEEFDRLRAEQG